jgi:hypothetical protein
MKNIIALFLLVACADPDINYTVKIIEIQKNTESVYCIYRTESVGEPKFEKGEFLDDCDKYKVGDVITLTY